MKRLYVIGSLHLDVVVRAPHLPVADETVAGSGVDYVFGGKGGNQTVAARRHGAEVSFGGRIGSDEFGNTLKEGLKDAAVNVSLLQKDKGASGMSVAIVDTKGDYGAVIVSAANLHIESDRILLGDDAGIVLLQNEVPEDVNLAVAEKARKVGAEVWLNAAPARELSAELLALVDVLIVNRVEAGFYAGQHIQSGQDGRIAARQLAQNGRTCIVTLGEAGVAYSTGDDASDHRNGFEVDVFSSHGAGDVFVGALASRRMAGQSLAGAVDYAQAAAALHVAAPLENRSAIDASTVARFLAKQKSRTEN